MRLWDIAKRKWVHAFVLQTHESQTKAGWKIHSVVVDGRMSVLQCKPDGSLHSVRFMSKTQ